MATEPLQAAPYPVSTDAPDGPAQILALAQWARTRVGQVYASAAARTSAFSAAGISAAEGMISYLQDVDRWEWHDGTNWVPFPGTRIATASSTGSVTTTGTTETTVLTASGVQLYSGRRYRVQLTARVDVSAAPTTWGVAVKASANAPAILATADGSTSAASGTGQQTYTWSEDFTATGTGTATITATVTKTTGAGDVTLRGPNSSPVGMSLRVYAVGG